MGEWVPTGLTMLMFLRSSIHFTPKNEHFSACPSRPKWATNVQIIERRHDLLGQHGFSWTEKIKRAANEQKKFKEPRCASRLSLCLRCKQTCEASGLRIHAGGLVECGLGLRGPREEKFSSTPQKFILSSPLLFDQPNDQGSVSIEFSDACKLWGRYIQALNGSFSDVSTPIFYQWNTRNSKYLRSQ